MHKVSKHGKPQLVIRQLHNYALLYTFVLKIWSFVASLTNKRNQPSLCEKHKAIFSDDKLIYIDITFVLILQLISVMCACFSRKVENLMFIECQIQSMYLYPAVKFNQSSRKKVHSLDCNLESTPLKCLSYRAHLKILHFVQEAF